MKRGRFFKRGSQPWSVSVWVNASSWMDPLIQGFWLVLFRKFSCYFSGTENFKMQTLVCGSHMTWRQRARLHAGSRFSIQGRWDWRGGVKEIERKRGRREEGGAREQVSEWERETHTHTDTLYMPALAGYTTLLCTWLEKQDQHCGNRRRERKGGISAHGGIYSFTCMTGDLTEQAVLSFIKKESHRPEELHFLDF